VGNSLDWRARTLGQWHHCRSRHLPLARSPSPNVLNRRFDLDPQFFRSLLWPVWVA
jgi:hypothetical protein